MRGNRAVVQRTEVTVQDGRLVVRLRLAPEALRLAPEAGAGRAAYLPDRELSALLPRCLLVGRLRGAPPQLLDTIRPMLDRLVRGCTVRVWEFRDRSYAAFPSWRSVRFQEGPD